MGWFYLGNSIGYNGANKGVALIDDTGRLIGRTRFGFRLLGGSVQDKYCMIR